MAVADRRALLRIAGLGAVAAANNAYHGPNLPRLREIAARYDPERVFAFPQSIRG